MLGTDGTFRCADRIHKKFDVLLSGESFKYIELVVEVVVRNDYVVVLFKLRNECLLGVQTFTGGACQLVLGEIVADVLFKDFRYDDNLVETVIRKIQNQVAAFIAEVLLFKCGIGECETKRNTLVVEGLYDAFDDPSGLLFGYERVPYLQMLCHDLSRGSGGYVKKEITL